MSNAIRDAEEVRESSNRARCWRAAVGAILVWGMTQGGGVPFVQGGEVPFRARQAIEGTDGFVADPRAIDYDRDGDLDLILHSLPAFGRTMVFQFEGPPPWEFDPFGVASFPFEGINAMELIDDRGVTSIAACGLYRGLRAYVYWNNRVIAQDYVNSLASGDVDGDGDIDLVGSGPAERVGDRPMGRITWWENKRDSRDYWVSHVVADLEAVYLNSEVADLDGDGDQDIVAGISTGQASLAWYENLNRQATAWRTHTIDTHRPASYEPMPLDLDLDGDLDLVTTHPIAPGVSIWRNTGGNFTLAASFGSSGFVTVADLDADGDSDLVLAPFRGTDLAWYENDRGALDTWTKHALEPSPAPLERHAPAGDFDRDGDLDIVYYATGIGAFWLENETIGRNATFPEKQVIRESVNGAECVQAADINRDGQVDLIGSAYHAGDIKVWLNLDPAHNLWLERTVSANFAGVEAVFSADVDGDGDLDVLGASLTADALRWWENDGASLPSWTEHSITASFDGAHDVCAADLDRDGDVDVVAVAYHANEVAWWENDGTPRNGGWTFHSITDSFRGANSVAVADLDGDRLPDIVATAWVNNQVLWWRNVESGIKRIFEPRRLADGFSGVRSVAVADVNGDGRADIVAAAFTLGRICWWENTPGTADWPMHRIDLEDFAGANDVCAADLDHDGDVDLVGAFMTEGRLRWWENVNGLGIQWQRRTLEMAFPSAAAVCAADIDRDGDLDLLAAAEGATDQMAWWANQGGQYALLGSATEPDTISAAQKVAILAVDAQHNGRSSDHAIELVSVQLRFDDASGRPLSTAQWNQLFDAVAIYRDDGDGRFGVEDTPVRSFSPTLSQGRVTLGIEDGRASASVAPARRTRFHLVLTTAASAPPPDANRFRCTYLASGASVAEDRLNDLPLLREFSADVSSPLYSISAGPVLQIKSISRSRAGDVRLSWNSLGADYSYTVEYSTLAAASPWRPIPWISWPILLTNWTDTQVLPDAPRVFYRIKADRRTAGTGP